MSVAPEDVRRIVRSMPSRVPNVPNHPAPPPGVSTAARRRHHPIDCLDTPAPGMRTGAVGIRGYPPTVRASWPGSMQSALLATLGRPGWWAMALAAFLVRGGVVLIVLPIVSLPTPAGLVTALAPAVEGIILGRPTAEGALIGVAVVLLVLAGLAAAGLAGAWLDLALVREATADEDLEAGWVPIRGSPADALAIRLIAHLPTLVALGYGLVRVIAVGYEEFMSPGDTAAPVVDRVVGRVPDVVLIVLIAWLVGETVGTLAARRATTGMSVTRALVASMRQLVRPRGLATLALSTGVLLGIIVPFAFASGLAWEHLRGYLLGGAEAVEFAAALILLVATWVLGLAILGVGLAWRAAAWTAEVAPD